MKKQGDAPGPSKPPPRTPPPRTPAPPATPPAPAIDPDQMTVALRQLIAQHGTYAKNGGKLPFPTWLQGQLAGYLKNHPGATPLDEADPKTDPLKWLTTAWKIVHGASLPDVLVETAWEEVWGWLADTSDTLPGDIQKVLETPAPPPPPPDAGVPVSSGDDGTGGDEGDGSAAGEGGGGGGCFAAGTLVATPDGFRAIEGIGKDDRVISRSEDTEVTSVQPVLRAWVHAQRPTMVLRLANGEAHRTTAQHRFFLGERGFVAAGGLKPGDLVTTRANGAIAIAGIESDAEACTVYNLSVAHAHTYFVGETEVWVHNVKDDGTNVDDSGDSGEPDAVNLSVKKPGLPRRDPVPRGPNKPGR